MACPGYRRSGIFWDADDTRKPYYARAWPEFTVISGLISYDTSVVDTGKLLWPYIHRIIYDCQ